MKKSVRLISLLLCFVLFFSACKNGGETPEDQSTTVPTSENNVQNNASKAGQITLPYNSADGLNPYFAKSYENLYICKYLFKPLYGVDGAYNANPVIAESVSVNGTSAVVKIKSGVSCRGSSPITAADVVYSFNMAKASYAYGGYLTNVISASVKSSNTVEFTLEFADIYTAGKLTFPIVKEGTADIQTAVPTGSGDYFYSEKKLISVSDSEKTIGLYEIGTNESAESVFKIGTTDFYFSDLSDCNYSATAGKTENVLLNNMVYLGMNSANGALNKYIRSAIAVKLDCEDIALSSYQGHAAAVKLPINPESTVAGQVNAVETAGDKALADRIIDNCGYTRYSGSAKANGAYLLSFSLIVNKDNRYRVAAAYGIADSLKESGINVRVELLSFEDYSQRIAAGNYELYLGEIKLDSSMDISSFFKDGTPFGTGIDKTGRSATEYFRYRAGEITPAEYFAVFAEEFPFIPICFRQGYAVRSSDFAAEQSGYIL
ncbi:MAG: ABC transporter substrate-binding protein [Candidatus Fimenecus sp.]